jgi:hypothetical protein
MAIELLPQIDITRFTEKILPITYYAKAWELANSQKYLKIILKLN